MSKPILADCTPVILAGGLGNRLRSVVSDRPKVLAEVNQKPFLTYLLEQLHRAGFRKTVLCTGYLGEHIEKNFGSRYKHLALFYSQETRPLGTAGALRLALPLVQTKSAIILNGDSFCGASLDKFYFHYQKRKVSAAIILAHVSDARRFGKVFVDAQGRVLHFLEKDKKEGSGWINAGIYLVKKELLRSIPSGGPVSLEKQLFPQWIQQGIYGHQSRARFMDIGTAESYNCADNFFSPKK